MNVKIKFIEKVIPTIKKDLIFTQSTANTKQREYIVRDAKE